MTNEDKLNLSTLVSTLKEYLKFNSTDGNIKRQQLRKHLKSLVELIPLEPAKFTISHD